MLAQLFDELDWTAESYCKHYFQ